MVKHKPDFNLPKEGLFNSLNMSEYEQIMSVVRTDRASEGKQLINYNQSLVLLAIALGSVERCREDIDKMYEENQEMYFAHYNHSRMSKSNVFNRFSIQTSEYIKKVYSIILVEEIHGKTLFINKLIKRSYKPVHTFNTHKKWFMIEEFQVWYFEKNDGRVENISGIYLDYSFYILIYLAHKENREIVPTILLETVREQYDTFNEKFEPLSALKRFENNSNVSSGGYEEQLDRITFEGQKSETVALVFENIRLIEELELAKNKRITPSNVQEYLIRMPLTRITNTILIIFEMLGISANILSETKLGNEELEKLTRYIYIIKNNNELTEREAEVILLSSLVTYALAKEYTNLRDVYYEGLKTRMQEKELQEQKEHEEKVTNLLNKISTIEADMKKTNEEMNAVRESAKKKMSEISRLEKETKRANSELDKAKENDKELTFLREFYFNAQADETQNEPEQDITLTEMKEKLRRIDGVIVGGRVALTTKLKEILPEFTFIADEEKTRNISFIKNKQILFLCKHNNHALYYKVMAETKNSDILITELKLHQNLDIVIRGIYNSCVNYKLL